MQSPMQQPMQWLMQSPIMARWREGRRQLDICILTPCGSLLDVFCMTFWYLLTPFGRRGRTFLDPGTTPGTFRARGAKSCEKVAKWPNFGRPWGPQFATISVKLMTFWRLVFCCFFGCPVCSQIAGPGSILGPICDAFRHTWDLWKYA